MTRGIYTYPTAFGDLTEEDRAAVARVVDSGRFTMGPETEALEAELAAYHGRKHAIACNSGSSANLLAVAAVTEGHRGIVAPRALVPALAWATTYAPLVQHGYRLELTDCDDGWNAPVPTVVPFHAPTVAVVCSILGNPVDLLGWERWALRAGVDLIEDNCESIGARDLNGVLTGTVGVASTLSFYWSHQVNGLEGGAVLTNDDELARLCRMLRDHGMTRSVDRAASFDAEYDFRLFGYNLRPLEINCAVARVGLRRLPETIAARTANHYRFWRGVGGHGLPLRSPVHRGQLSPFGLPFELEDPGIDRPALVAALRHAGVDARPPTGGSLRRHAYGAAYQPWRTPNADRIHDRGLFIGNPPFDAPELIELAIDALRRAL